MENYYVQGILLEGKKAVIAVALPKPAGNNRYGIYGIYNISNRLENKVVIHFKDFLGKALSWDGINFESFIIDLSNLNNNGFSAIDFTKEIRVAFHHENNQLERTPVEIFDKRYNDDKVTPDSTGRGTIRESV